MARKRKLDSSKSTEPIEPPKKQAQIPVEEPIPQNEPVKEDLPEYEVEEEEEEEQEENEEEEEEEDDDEEEDEEEEEADNPNQNSKVSSSSVSAVIIDDDDEPIQNLLEPFSKDQLIALLREAAEKHADIDGRIRNVADADPAHRKIFVHGLGWDTNADTLISVFKQYGEIEDCKAVCDKVSGKSKGYGFILFKKRSGARKALKEPQKKIGNRMTACQLASIGPVPTTTTTAAVPTPQVPPASEYTQRKIYVSNVGADVDPQKLLSFFSQFGELEEGPLGLDKATGKPKGFCLFVFKGIEGARKALEEPHKNFEGHMLHCQKAIDGPKPGKAQHQHSSHNSQFHRNKNPNYGSSAASGSGHLMAPAGPGVGYNQGPPQALNPALGQALTALLASQGAGLGLTNLLGSLGTAGLNPAVQGAGPGIQSGYGSQTSISPGVVGYGTQSGVQGGYPNQQMGQTGSGRGQHGVGQYGGPGSYMGH